MGKRVLVTGGAGFIGLSLVRTLLKRGATVRVLDNFSPQVHSSASLPADLDGEFQLIRGDVRDRELMRRALMGIDVVVHLAAETGTGQSMYEIERYFSVNVQGTATLIDLLQNDFSAKSVGSLVVASSRAVYGEGAYRCATHGVVFPSQRTQDLMSRGYFEPSCPFCSKEIGVQPTPESAVLSPMSIYGLTKQMQEQAILMFARTRGMNGFALRYQNVYGPGQSLKNPYTGILAVFSNLARQHLPIEIYEDGLESRDFVYIDDVVEATVRAIDFSGDFCGALNVGSGSAVSVIDVAQEIKSFFNSESSVATTSSFRIGDIRHSVADLTRLRGVLDFIPRVGFKEGLSKFLDWAAAQSPSDRKAYERSVSELVDRGLMGKIQSHE